MFNYYSIVCKTQKSIETPYNYTASHPELTQQKWKNAVRGNNTLEGYWEWVAIQLGLAFPTRN